MAGALIALAGGAAAWFLSSVNGPTALVQDYLGLRNDNIVQELGSRLSSGANIFLPGSAGFENATDRWTPWRNPHFDVVVEVANEEDVRETIRYANANEKPFLAISGQHGGTTALGDVKNGTGIWLRKMTDVSIAENGKSAVIGGGIKSKELVDKLWKHGKMTVTGACECTGVVAPMLGGGHGWLQGRYGLSADNLISAHLVLANGTIVTVSDIENIDLFWALRGAGHNFGIVTSFEYKIHDRTPENEKWALETFIFTHDRLEAVYEAANKQLDDRPIELAHLSLFTLLPDVDPEKPAIMFVVLYHGTSIPSAYTRPFAALGPVVHTKNSTDLPGIAPFLGYADNSPACQHGTTYLRFPVGAVNYSVAGLRKAHSILASLPPKFNSSVLILEGYSMQGVQDVPGESTAFPERYNNLLMAPFIVHEPHGADADADAEAAQYGSRVRDAIVEANGSPLNAYVNYAYGDESPKALYGYEEWRLERLRMLKRAWDPKGAFDFYNPIN